MTILVVVIVTLIAVLAKVPNAHSNILQQLQSLDANSNEGFDAYSGVQLLKSIILSSIQGSSSGNDFNNNFRSTIQLIQCFLQYNPEVNYFLQRNGQFHRLLQLASGAATRRDILEILQALSQTDDKDLVQFKQFNFNGPQFQLTPSINNNNNNLNTGGNILTNGGINSMPINTGNVNNIIPIRVQPLIDWVQKNQNLNTVIQRNPNLSNIYKEALNPNTGNEERFSALFRLLQQIIENNNNNQNINNDITEIINFLLRENPQVVQNVDRNDNVQNILSKIREKDANKNDLITILNTIFANANQYGGNKPNNKNINGNGNNIDVLQILDNIIRPNQNSHNTNSNAFNGGTRPNNNNAANQNDLIVYQHLNDVFRRNPKLNEIVETNSDIKNLYVAVGRPTLSREERYKYVEKIIELIINENPNDNKINFDLINAFFQSTPQLSEYARKNDELYKLLEDGRRGNANQNELLTLLHHVVPITIKINVGNTVSQTTPKPQLNLWQQVQSFFKNIENYFNKDNTKSPDNSEQNIPYLLVKVVGNDNLNKYINNNADVSKLLKVIKTDEATPADTYNLIFDILQLYIQDTGPNDNSKYVSILALLRNLVASDPAALNNISGNGDILQLLLQAQNGSVNRELIGRLLNSIRLSFTIGGGNISGERRNNNHVTYTVQAYSVPYSG